MIRRVTLGLTMTLAAVAGGNAQEVPMTTTDELSRFAGLALDCVHREYPNQISHVMQSDDDAAPPRRLTPVFYGCYDWHSAVHAHWLLVRLLHHYPEAEFAGPARDALAAGFTAQNVAGEVAYFHGAGRAGFERPYGLAWFLQLTAELRAADQRTNAAGTSPQSPDFRAWLTALTPLEDVVARRFQTWLPNLLYPVRSGTHNQTAFAFALALDWARMAGRDDLETVLVDKARRFYTDDRDCPLAYEPSGEDFLSPCLMEADLMRRIIPAGDYPAWLTGFLPGIPRDGSVSWLQPGVVQDPADGKLVHLDGMNLSRAWNLQAIAASLPADDARRPALLAAAAEHRRVGLAAVTGEHYSGGHWLASFATYLVTGPAAMLR